MKVESAIKKLNKAGFNVKQYGQQFIAIHKAASYCVQFYRNGGMDSVTCINVRRHDERDEIETDYVAGVFADNITQAIKLAMY